LSLRERIFEVAEDLSKSKPFDQITFQEIARKAGVHWTTVRRQFGSKEAMRTWLKEKQEKADPSLADTRRRILEAGERMFARLGYVQASLDKVASEAGLTKGAVYWHFSSKQDLFLAILERHLQQQLRLLPTQIDHIWNANDPVAALTDWLQAQFSCLEKEDRSSMLFLEFVTSSREPDIHAKLQSVHGKILDGVAVFMGEMQNKGLVRDSLDAQSISIMIDALMKGVVVEWLIDPKRCNVRTVFHTIARVLWEGLSPRQ
jgi:AcrR family transcriptional regulator